MSLTLSESLRSSTVTSSGVSNRGPLGCRQATTGAERRERSSDGGAALNDEGVNIVENAVNVLSGV